MEKGEISQEIKTGRIWTYGDAVDRGKQACIICYIIFIINLRLLNNSSYVFNRFTFNVNYRCYNYLYESLSSQQTPSLKLLFLLLLLPVLKLHMYFLTTSYHTMCCILSSSSTLSTLITAAFALSTQ